jgi:hypothetical protein
MEWDRPRCDVTLMCLASYRCERASPVVVPRVWRLANNVGVTPVASQYTPANSHLTQTSLPRNTEYALTPWIIDKGSSPALKSLLA